jgi:CarD family transcriptional regulator
MSEAAARPAAAAGASEAPDSESETEAATTADATPEAEAATMTDAAPSPEAPATADTSAGAAAPGKTAPQPVAEAGATAAAESDRNSTAAAAPATTAAAAPATTAAAAPATEAAAKPAAKPEPAKKKRAAGTKGGKKVAAKTTTKTDAAAGAKTAAKSRTGNAAKADVDDKAPAAKSSRKIARRRLQYKVGQQLVYPLQGVGQIRNIEERPFRNQTLLYYVVYLEVSDMTIMVPVDKADELGIRAIVPRAEARNALVLIGEDYEPIPTDWKLRYQMNLDLLKAGSVSDIAAVVRALYHRSRIKELPILERKLYDNARSLLVDELSFSLGKDKGTIEEMINSRLQAGVKA